MTLIVFFLNETLLLLSQCHWQKISINLFLLFYHLFLIRFKTFLFHSFSTWDNFYTFDCNHKGGSRLRLVRLKEQTTFNACRHSSTRLFNSSLPIRFPLISKFIKTDYILFLCTFTLLCNLWCIIWRVRG